MATILIVEDSQAVLDLLVSFATEAGHAPLRATTGREAVAVLRRDPIDLVVTDIYMPDMDGLELLSFAKSRGLEIPFIAMSSKPEGMNFFSVARAFGARSVLRKPFSKEQFLAAITSSLKPHEEKAAQMPSDGRSDAGVPLSTHKK